MRTDRLTALSAQRLSVAALLPILVLACSSGASAPMASTSGDLPDALRARALDHVAEAFERGLAPEWAGATLGEAHAIRRPDVDGPAYYEVAVEHDGKPAGYVVVSTGDHDYPVIQWNTHGELPTARLRAQAEAAGRHAAAFYRVDVGYVAETEDGEIAASDITTFAPLVRAEDRIERGTPYASWAEAKAHFAEGYGTYLDALRKGAHAAWQVPMAASHLKPGAIVQGFGQASASPTDECQVNDWQTSPHYDQLRSYQPPSGRWYASGCAATAWALMIGWADIQADEGDPKWASYAGLYRQGASQNPNDPDARAPMSFDWGVRVMVDRISSTLGTWGVSNPSGMSDGATEPWRMSKITDYLNDSGMRGSIIAATFDWGGGAFDSLRDRAVKHICVDQSPAVIGIGSLTHYALATKHWKNFNDTHFFYLNMGHGGSDDSWQTPGIFFAGTLIPQFPGPEMSSTDGMEITSATYGGNCGQQEDNVAAHISTQCNNLSSCDYGIDHRIIGDPAVGCAKDYYVEYRCSATGSFHYAYVGPEASGKVAHLACPTIKVLSATYGGNCGAPAGNKTLWGGAVCNGRSQCKPEIDYRIIGDPVPGCAKDFVMQYQCAGGAVQTASAPPEAGFGSVLSLSCP